MALIGKKTPHPRKEPVYVVRWNDASHHQVSRTFARLEDAKQFARNGQVAMEPGRLYNANAGRTMDLEAPTDAPLPPHLSAVPDLARLPDDGNSGWSRDRPLGH